MKPQVAFVLLALVACKQGDGDDYMIIPGGPTHPGGGSQGADAAINGDGGGGAVLGRVCLALDPRALTACAGSGAGALTVTLGSDTTTTTDDGSFGLIVTDDSTMQWTVSGAAIVTSVKLAASPGDIPAITQDTYADMVSQTGGLLTTGQGSVMVRAITVGSGAPAVGALGVSATGVSDVYYDTGSATNWADNQLIGTGTFGDVWVPIEPIGTAQLTVTPAGGGSAFAVPDLVVVDQAITFATVTLP